MFRSPHIPAPDLSTAARWEREERALNDFEERSYGLSGASIRDLTDPEHFEACYDLMEAERDHNQEVCDRYGDL